MELAQMAQAAAPAGALALFGTALTLGLRHGVDWDHIAAITDITTTTASAGMAGRTGASAGRRTPSLGVVTEAPPLSPVLGRIELRAVGLASLYALGHATVVVALGLAALAFGALLPDWIDPIMERLVGVTLVALGLWLVYSLVRYRRGGADFRLRSRWMLVFDGAGRAWAWAQTKLHGHRHHGAFHVHPVARADQYGPRTAFGTGVIHGIGAETGTQVLLIAAVGGAASEGLGAGMLLAFVLGLLVSNTALALLTSTGFVSASRTKGLYVAVGCLAAVFSLVVGGYALLGVSDQLPDLQEVLGAVFGEAPA